ncbi:MAG: outer membrane protein assembly factor BamB [Planctomycetota bacterium]|jgi:outer membrane protein assembly factor BamB
MSTSEDTKRRAYIPGLWYRILLILAAGLGGWLWIGDPTGDEGMRNVFTMMLTSLMLGIGFLWFLLRSAYRPRTRIITILLITAAFWTFDQCFELRGFSGAMIPDYVRRGDVTADAGPGAPTMAVEQPSEDSLDLSVNSFIDWPGFMGPKRTGIVDHLQVTRDWSANPPKVLWKHSVGAGWGSFAVVAGTALTCEELDVEAGVVQVVRAYDVNTGDLHWETSFTGDFDHPLGGRGPRSTPSVAAGKVVVLLPDGRLLCLRGADGTIHWERDLIADFGITADEEKAEMGYGRANSPLIVEGGVIVPVGLNDEVKGAGLVCLDLNSGETLWKSPTRVPSFSSPMLARLNGRDQILILNEKTITGHDPAGGEILWEHPWPSKTEGDSNNSQPMVVGEDRVFVSRGYGAGCSVFVIEESDAVAEPDAGSDSAEAEGEADVTKHEYVTRLLWHSRRSLRTKMTSAVHREGHAYGLSDGMLECVDLETGARIWKEGRYGHGQLLLIDDLLLLISEEGELKLIEATPEGEGELLASMPVLDGKTWNLLALYGDRLLARNGTEAACVRLPGELQASGE